MELTERQKLILSMVVHDYSRSAAPIGSKNLVEHYNLDLSSATVRNELQKLTDFGLLRMPHTSAGRVPTEEGYRYYVSNLTQTNELPVPTQKTISHQFYQMRHDMEQWLRLAGSVLAHQSHAASLVTSPLPRQAKLKHLQVISTRGRQVLLILVLEGGEIRQRVLSLAEPVSQEQLTEASARLTALLHDLDVESLPAAIAPLDGLNRDLADWVLEDLTDENAAVSSEVYIDGLTNILSEPEFTGSEENRKALRIIEERSLLRDLVAKTSSASNQGSIQVLIGGEGTWDELRQWSLVLGSYGLPGLATGALGVLGPLRLSYGRAISTIQFLSNLMSEMMAESIVEGNDN
ncbi:MAG TPA: heat-inducible transcriptional repressor HrcA [Bellilinea sp.]|nr:heat-inducible transcriptional repressor HrcA [Bellilinea sp.]